MSLTARRTTLIRHLHLDFGYEQDVDPAVLASAILEAIENSKLIQEMGIVFVEASSAHTPGASTITIYAPVDEVRQDSAEPEEPPQTPDLGAGAILRLEAAQAQQRQDEELAHRLEVLAERHDPTDKICPACGKNSPDTPIPATASDRDDNAEGQDDEQDFELCADCEADHCPGCCPEEGCKDCAGEACDNCQREPNAP